MLRQSLEESLRLERIDISFTHLAVLYSLEAEPGIAGAEIARRCFVTAQTMNTMLRRMEADGDVERRPHPGNSRADSWHLSRRGQRKLDRAKIVGDSVWGQLLSALKAAEVTQLQELLQRCIQGFGAAGTDVPDSRPRATKTGRSAAAAGRSRG